MSEAVVAAARTALSCTHCGLPVPLGLIDEGAEEQFCCAGCRAAFELVAACRVALPDGAGEERRGSGARYGEFDDPAFVSLFVKPADGGLSSIELMVEGVHCASCVWLLERLPRVVPGVIESRLNVRLRTLRVVFDGSVAQVSAIARAVDGFGYRPHPAKGSSLRELHQRELRRQLIELGIAASLAGNVMILAFALYGGVFGGIEPRFEQPFRWVSMVLGVACLAWPGRVFFRGAWAAVRTRAGNLDLPIAIALGTGGVMGVVNTVRGAGELYFDSVTAVVFLLLVGRFVHHRQQRWSADSLELLFSLIPARARLVEGGTRRVVPIESIELGQVVEVLPTESVPTDGVIQRGSTSVDQALLTGEARPVDLAAGDTVAAGSVNLGSPIVVRVTAVGRETRAGRLMALIERAATERPRLSTFTDRVGSWFVVAVLLAAAVTAAVWLPRDPEAALSHAMAMLIVTCPCMFGLATPLAMSTAIGRVARRGILIKSPAAIESLSVPGVLVLDKTGTLTEARPTVRRWYGHAGVRGAVAAVESMVQHPVARALASFDWTGEPQPVVEELRHTLGGGVEARVDGVPMIIGSPKHVKERGAMCGPAARLWEQAIVAAGESPVLVAVGGEVVAAAGIGDRVRDEASDVLTRLRAMGWSVRMLSGDHVEAAAAVGRRLGFATDEVMAGVDPEGKVKCIEALRSVAQATGRPVVMVGDGVNDAAALAAATVGVAVHGGAEASLAAADVAIQTPGVDGLIELASGARRTMMTIRLVLWASVVYNVVAAGLTVAGEITPWIAAIIMPLNSLTTTLIATRGGAFRARSRRERIDRGVAPSRGRVAAVDGSRPAEVVPCP